MFYKINEIKGIDVFPKATFRPDVGYYYIVYLLIIDGVETQLIYSVDENICRTIQGEPLKVPDDIISRILQIICIKNKNHEIVQLNDSGTQELPQQSCTYDKSVYVEKLKKNVVEAGLDYDKIAVEIYNVEAQKECYYLKEVNTYYYKINLSKGKEESRELIYIVNTDQFKDARKQNVVELPELIHGDIVRNIVANNPDYIVIPVRSDRLILKDKADYSRIYENMITRNEMKYLSIREKNQKLEDAGEEWINLASKDKKIQERFLKELNMDDMEKNFFANEEIKEFIKEKLTDKILSGDPETILILRELEIDEKTAVRVIMNETKKGRKLATLLVHAEIYDKTPVNHPGKEKLLEVINGFKKLLRKGK